MGFDKLTKEEEAFLKAFLYIREKLVDDSGFKINKLETGRCLTKINNKWASFGYAHGEKYNYTEFDNLYSLCMYYLNSLKDCTGYDCVSLFPLILKNVLNNEALEEDNIQEFDDLSEEEQEILSVFIDLMEELGDLNRHVVCPTEEEIDKIEHVGERIQLYKNGNKWVSYVLERNIRVGYCEYDNLIDACNDIFEGLEKDHTDYCVANFPDLVKEALSKLNKIK